ncbi:MAG: HRDC domain-containing protein [Gammaproteobacteria bacterium]|nr:HRDC domain-containing protein [Gammaproteobacteria bacterium]
MNYLIEEQSQLKELEPRIRRLCECGGVVSIDTEFLREKTYNAKLCLLQIGIEQDQFCIDVLNLDCTELLTSLFSATNVLKLLHAARQDMEVIVQTFGVLPKPIFDTQLAAAFCGADMQIGYGALVEDVAGVVLAKTQSRTDWTKRPLSDEQIKYAGEDVAYLEQLFIHGKARLEEQQKTSFFEAELESYYDESLYIIDPDKAYLRLSGGMLKIKHQHQLKALANWRESSAQDRNIPRTWIMRDDKLYELAQSNPKSDKDILEMGLFGRKSSNRLAAEALQVIKGVHATSERVWRKVEPLSKADKSKCSSLMKELSRLAEQHHIAQALLGTRKDIESLYRHRQSKKLLKGWRSSMVGQPLLQLLETLDKG